jgi:hypothetical protein
MKQGKVSTKYLEVIVIPPLIADFPVACTLGSGFSPDLLISNHGN